MASEPVLAGALAVLIAAGLWLIVAAWMMVFRPERALALLRRTAASHRVNLTEQLPRMIVGFAAVVRAPVSAWPMGYDVAGWFVVASSIALIAMPLRWHAGYAVWWADRTPTWAVRSIAPLSLAAGAALILAAL